MKIIEEQTIIQRYVAQYKLDQVFSHPDALPFQLRTYEKDGVVLSEGEKLDGLYFQVKGRTRVSSSVETGKSLLLRFCHPFAVFGDVELLQNIVIQSQVEATEQTSFLFINKHKIETELMQDYKFLHFLLKQLSYKLQTCTTASRVNLLTSVEERFASYLLTTQDDHLFGKEMFTSYIPDIASLIGTTPRHLNRVIHKFSEMNILKKETKKIIVLDWSRLDEYSNGLRYE
ncbi:Crp/Fnr family transcriptional regulator [Paenibacillus sp. GSMTC-2017]|uniref:Crp/Fnr family transcriptional regulator n=1 Tax=Paenibacillus sp. GSMTC-2017 TaxID=2794350 RepID=UPI0018D6AE42|nr:Crp/Fnr family transcriptional regulator [Paenibacillus sp. GSMTC-2017]MBH5316251.1 Crp/Fnr family transcriptional regulator [Paenibacillus sp. GSMTC-2017]